MPGVRRLAVAGLAVAGLALAGWVTAAGLSTSPAPPATASVTGEAVEPVDAAASRSPYVATRLPFEGVREEVAGERVEVSIAADVLFEVGSAELGDDAEAILERTAGELDADATGTVTIIGHTDDVGDRASNQELSEERAGAVHDALSSLLGDTDLDFDVEGRAFDEPAVEGTSDEARAANRRVEISYERG